MRPISPFLLAAFFSAAVFVPATNSYAQQPAATPPAATTTPADDAQTPPPPRTSRPSLQPPPAASTTKPTDTTQPATAPPADTTQPASTQTPSTDATISNDKGTKADKKDKKDKDKTNAQNDVLPSPGEDMRTNIKPGSEDDVNAIGTRNIGGRGIGNWYSTNWEISVGKQYSMEIEKSAHLITDPVIVEYVNRVGQNLVKNSDAKVPFTIKVLDSDEINAMALPGGFFYVNSGLILACDEEAELAGVMAHEISHVIAHHAAREQTKMNYAQIGSIPLIIMTSGTWAGYGIYEATQLAIPLTFLKFSRISESEADYLGIEYMYHAGYDPQAFISLFEKLDALEKHKPGSLAKAFSDHPQTPDRIAASEEEIATILPAKPDYLVTTSEFDDVKARLARIENKRKLNDKGNGNKPTLRRTSAGGSNNDPNNPSSSTDDRPTLGKH